MTRSGLGTQAALSLSLIAAFGYTIPNCDVLFSFLGLGFLVFALFVCFCFCALLVAGFLFPVMEWYYQYMHNEPGSLSQHRLHLL